MMLNNIKYINRYLIIGYVQLLSDKIDMYINNTPVEVSTKTINDWIDNFPIEVEGVDEIAPSIIDCLNRVLDPSGIMVYEIIDKPKFDKLIELIESIEKVLENEPYPIKLKIEYNDE